MASEAAKRAYIALYKDGRIVGQNGKSPMDGVIDGADIIDRETHLPELLIAITRLRGFAKLMAGTPYLSADGLNKYADELGEVLALIEKGQDDDTTA